MLSNPDMLHSGILPHHPRWAKLFENLSSSSSTSCTRIAACSAATCRTSCGGCSASAGTTGPIPIFICSSATIANPRELAEGLTGRPFELIEQSGAPRGEKFFLFVNPPVVNAELGIRRSYLGEARRVALEFLKHNLQLILFAQSRLAIEILTTYLKDAFHGPPGASDVIRGYRGGYLPNRRREIERGLREGSVRAVVSTSALELGIDIGALDVSVMAGYPGTIAATWQRAGRAGRRTTRSAAVLVASSAPIDQFIIRNPSYFFDASPEHALINPDNLHILLDHVKCAAFELPFTADEPFGRQENVQEILAVLAEEGFVHHADGQWNWTNESYPADAVSLRSVSSDNFVVVDMTDGERVIGETDFTSGAVDAAREGDLHHRGAAVPGRAARLRRPQGLRARRRLRLLHRRDHLHEGDDSRHVRVSDRARLEAGAQVTKRTLERHSIARRSPRRLARRRVQEDQVLHERERRVRRAGSARAADAHVVVLADDSVRGDGGAAVRRRRSARRRGRAGVRDAARRAAAADVRSARHRRVDRRRIARAHHAHRRRRRVPEPALAAEPNIFIYDNYPGGIGFSRPLFDMHRLLLERTRELIDGCPCESGCPSCVGPEGNTGPHAKVVASRILAALLAPPRRMRRR